MSVIYIEKDDIASAWIEALKRVLEEGDEISTSYDKGKEIPSKDSTVRIKVNNPFSNPMRNRRSKEKKVLNIKSRFGNSYEVYGHMGDYCLVGSIQSGYIEECLEGVFDDNLVKSKSSYPYSYHNRLFNYSPYGLEDIPFKSFNLDIRKILDFEECEKLESQLSENEELKQINTICSFYLYGDALGECQNLGGKCEDHNNCDFKDSYKDITLTRNNGEKINLTKKLLKYKRQIPIEFFNFPQINQIDLVIKGLKKSPNSRRIQATTWRPLSDPFRDDPPCLQRLHFRIKDNKLIMNTHWRSRDLFKAWQSNVNAMIRIQELVANELGLEVGSYLDVSDSLHIYGRDIEKARELI